MFKKLIFPLVFGLMVAVFALVAPRGASASADQHVPGQVLVKFKDGVASAATDSVLRGQSAKVKSSVKQLGVLVLQVPAGAEDRVVTALSHNPNVDFAELDYVATALDFPVDAPSDFYFGNQWALDNGGQDIVGQTGIANADINARDAWQVTTGFSFNYGGFVKVAILDTGIDQNHPDVSDKIVTEVQQNFTDSTSVDDFYGHGTHVSGIVAADTDNGEGVAGTCPKCRLLNVKVLNDSGSGAYSWIANGIIWAADNGAQVINMSLGGSVKSKTLEQAVNYAWNKNVVVVAAAGNSGNSSKTYPAAYNNAISVAATDNQDHKASFSEYGSWVDVAAPGVNVFSTFPTHPFYLQSEYGRSLNYDFGSGTSMSTPVTSAVAALIWSTDKYTTAQEVRDQLQRSADPIAGTGSYWIWGRVNAANAVGDSVVPTPTPTPTGGHGHGHGSGKSSH